MPRAVTEKADLLPALSELFRERGLEGASLSLITLRTGLGKGSLYHFFPGGKEEMAAWVLEEIDNWFERNLFKPLREHADPDAAIAAMFRAVEDYFRSGQRVCLVGALALGEARDRFAEQIQAYFIVWCRDLAAALRRAGRDAASAADLAEETVAGIQGALVLARATDDPTLFARTLRRLEARLSAA